MGPLDCQDGARGVPLNVIRLRQRNLYDTGLPPADAELRARAADLAYRSRRTLDGTLNDLGSPVMGSIGTPFGRNVPLDHTLREPEQQLLDPNPRTISRELLTRERFLNPLPAHDSRSSEPRSRDTHA